MIIYLSLSTDSHLCALSFSFTSHPLSLSNMSRHVVDGGARSGRWAELILLIYTLAGLMHRVVGGAYYSHTAVDFISTWACSDLSPSLCANSQCDDSTCPVGVVERVVHTVSSCVLSVLQSPNRMSYYLCPREQQYVSHSTVTAAEAVIEFDVSTLPAVSLLTRTFH